MIRDRPPGNPVDPGTQGLAVRRLLEPSPQDKERLRDNLGGILRRRYPTENVATDRLVERPIRQLKPLTTHRVVHAYPRSTPSAVNYYLSTKAGAFQTKAPRLLPSPRRLRTGASESGQGLRRAHSDGIGAPSGPSATPSCVARRILPPRCLSPATAEISLWMCRSTTRVVPAVERVSRCYRPRRDKLRPRTATSRSPRQRFRRRVRAFGNRHGTMSVYGATG